MTVFFIIITLVYLVMVVTLLFAWESLPIFFALDDVTQASTHVTVIVPVRNEAKNIKKLLLDLNSQDYPVELLEVIIVDDFSTDQTVNNIKQAQKEISYSLKIIKIPEQYKGQPNKKRAIGLAISESKGSLIVTTDGDCRVGSGWIKTIEEFYIGFDCKMICGPVFIQNIGSLWSEMQRIEFSSLIGSGAASLSLGMPNMCNGANLAYSKEVFYEVGGFEGNLNIASGDDEFLMHKIHNKHPGKVKFLKSTEAIVTTFPQSTLKDLINQRKRWASKWPAYNSMLPKCLAFFVFLYNLSVIAGCVAWLSGYLSGFVFFEQILIKILAEFVFLRRIVSFSGKKINIIGFLLLEILYPFYVVLVALGGLTKGYEWKGRKIK